MSTSDYIKNIRRKIGSATLMLPSVAAVILNENNQLLLQEKHGELWSLPAGMIELGESPREAVIREAAEETGLEVEPTKILGTFGGSDFSYIYPNGDQVEYTVILMLCEIRGSTVRPIDSETKLLRYFDKEDMPELALPYPKKALFNETAEAFIE